MPTSGATVCRSFPPGLVNIQDLELYSSLLCRGGFMDTSERLAARGGYDHAHVSALPVIAASLHSLGRKERVGGYLTEKGV